MKIKNILDKNKLLNSKYFIGDKYILFLKAWVEKKDIDYIEKNAEMIPNNTFNKFEKSFKSNNRLDITDELKNTCGKKTYLRKFMDKNFNNIYWINDKYLRVLTELSLWENIQFFLDNNKEFICLKCGKDIISFIGIYLI